MHQEAMVFEFKRQVMPRKATNAFFTLSHEGKQDKNIELIFEYIDRLQEDTRPSSYKGVTVVEGFDMGEGEK